MEKQARSQAVGQSLLSVEDADNFSTVTSNTRLVNILLLSAHRNAIGYC